MTEARLRRRRQRFATIPRDLLRNAEISPGARLLYALLDDYSNGADDAPWPAQPTLADHLGVTDRCVRNWLNELARTGWLDVEHRPGTSSLHWLNDTPTPRNESSAPPRNESSAPPRNHSSDEGEPVEGEPVEGQPTPTPPEGGDDEAALSLLDELPVGQRGADRRTEQRRRAATAEVPPMIVAQFETWLANDWPGPKRNTTNARTVFAKVLNAGETVADLQRQARNYRRGLEIWAETFGDDRKPMGVGPFLAYRGKPSEGKRHLWDQATPADVSLEHCRDVIGWPPPPGRTWERPRRRPKLSELGVAGGG